MPPIEGPGLQSYLVTTCYFIIIFGLGYHKAFQHSFLLQWMTIRALKKVKAIILEQWKKIEIQIENHEPETKFCSFLFFSRKHLIMGWLIYNTKEHSLHF